ncbi:MAG: FtsX-like permease family protein [Melioribacteraceae bacterium]|nr:MAG: FtsX-like permease family protein [Melioribacteraceae bacterium]
MQNSIEFLSEKWKEFGQSKPLEYSFFDENFEETYRSEIQAGKVFTSFAVLAIVIASLGLFGLAAFTAEQRTKEIGIRKVLGSSITQIIMLLSQEFMKWVLISNILAWPVAYYIMHRWLEDFVYRININLIYFALAGLITLMIAILTVSYQSIKAAFSNPINSLRYE